MQPSPSARDARADLAAVVARGDAPGSAWLPGTARRLRDLEEGRLQARRAAVLVLLGELDREPAQHPDHAPTVHPRLDVLLLARAHTLTHHAGQVAFPGGAVDPDDASVTAAALREAHEETGLDPAGVEVLGALPAVPVPVSGFLVTPVVAWWARPTPVRAVDVAESAEVFRVPVADLLDPDNRGTVTVTRGSRTFRGPAFEAEGHVVWGFTALVLDHLFDAAGWTVPWDRARPVTLTGR